MDKNLPIVKLVTGSHRGKSVIFIKFQYDGGLISTVKKIRGCTWSQTSKSWYVESNSDNLGAVLSAFKGVSIIDDEELESIATNSEKNENPILKVLVNDAENRIYLTFPYNSKWIEIIKTLQGVWYHVGARTWSIIGGENSLNELMVAFSKENCNIIVKNGSFTVREKKVKTEKVKKENLVEDEYRRQLMLKNLSDKTIESYCGHVNQMLHYFRANKISISDQDIPLEAIKNYLFERIVSEGFSNSYHRQITTAVRKYFNYVHRTELDEFELPTPKKEKGLPKVISKESAAKMFSQPKFLKHKIIIGLLYGCGLRCNEVLELNVKDIDFERKMIRVKGKGKKIRVVPMPQMLVGLLKEYIKSYLPTEHLIEGQNGGKYSPKSVQEIVKRTASEVSIKQVVTPHMLRHSYATHLLEDGVGIRIIQELLGHSSSKTTEIYTFVSRKTILNVCSPLDKIINNV